MKNTHLIIIITITFAIGGLLAHYGNKDSIVNFLREFPNISGILLSGVLASLAIIFGLMGIEELSKIQKIENYEIGSYENLLKELKDDVWVVLGVVIISTSLSVFSSSDTELFALTILNRTISAELFKIIFVIDFVFLMVTLLAIYDIIIALFEISHLKYEAAKKRIDK
jgi:hypothetical protein